MTEKDATARALAIAALGHPTRVQVLALMDEGETLPPRIIAERLGEQLENLSYHVRCLRTAGLLRLVRRRMGRRGAVEHLYVITDLGRHALAVTDMLVLA